MASRERGRPSCRDIIIENIPKIRQLVRDGYTEEQCAKAIGVGPTTFIKWKPTIPELVKALKESKQVLIEELEDTMYRKALGKCKIKTTKKYIEDVNGVQKTRIEETTQDVAPDTTLLIFSLKNLTADTGKWQDRRDINNFNDLQKAIENSSAIFDKMEKALNSEETGESEE